VKTNHHWVIAVSLSNLLLMHEWVGFIVPSRDTYFINDLSVSNLIALGLVFLALTVSIYGALRIAENNQSRLWSAWIYVALLLALVIPFNQLRVISEFSIRYPWFSLSRLLGNWGFVGNFAKLALFAVASIGAFVYFRRLAIPAFRQMLLVTAPLCAFVVWHVASGHASSHASTAPRTLSENSPRHRVVWLVFDGMDRYLTFGERPKELPLPALDRLLKESLSAPHANPPASLTIRSLPAYISGRVVTDAKPVGASDLILSLEGESKTERWSRLPNVFAEVKQQGLRTGITGWYHPYCRIFRNDLDECAWFSLHQYPYGHSIVDSVRKVFWNAFRIHVDWGERHEAIYEEILSKAKQMLSDAKLDFVVVHWPIPHLPPLVRYHRRRYSYEKDGRVDAYYNNLAVADDAIGMVRQAMESSGVWEKTTVILTSDHPWRFVPKEFVEAQKEPYTHWEVPFLVKMEGQNRSYVYNQPMESIWIHDLSLDVIRGKVGTVEQLDAWLGARSRKLQHAAVRGLPGASSSRNRQVSHVAEASEAELKFLGHDSALED
jgi:hypothetical protein